MTVDTKSSLMQVKERHFLYSSISYFEEQSNIAATQYVLDKLRPPNVKRNLS